LLPTCLAFANVAIDRWQEARRSDCRTTTCERLAVCFRRNVVFDGRRANDALAAGHDSAVTGL
jgi:hypothetical protein